MIFCSFLRENEVKLFTIFAIALLNKTGNSWKSLHSIISKIRTGVFSGDINKELPSLIRTYGIQEDDLWYAEKTLDRIIVDGWNISFYPSNEYPSGWVPYGEKSPPVIFLKGRHSKKPKLWCALVGTTTPDPPTKELVIHTVKLLNELGCGIVTGGAPGVDSISAETAFYLDIPILIIIPSGALYYNLPSFIQKAFERGICQIISPWSPNSKWCKSQAVRRNFLIGASASAGFIFNPTHEGGSFRVAKSLFSRNLPVFVHMPEQFAWHLRYSKLVYPISTSLDLKTLKDIVSTHFTSAHQSDNDPLELF